MATVGKRFDILCFLNAVSKIQLNFEISRTDNKRLDWFFCKIYLEILRRRHFGNWVQLISRELMQPWKKNNGKISLLNTVGKTEYIYIKVILDGWLEDVMVNGYVCSATSSGAPRAKRARGAPWVNKSTHPRKCGNHGRFPFTKKPRKFRW